MNDKTQQKIGESRLAKYTSAIIRAILPAISQLYADSANTSGNTDTVSSVGNPVKHSRHSSYMAKPLQVQIKKK
jgi:hypothetical protein